MKDPIQNIYMAAKHLASLRDVDFKEIGAEDMTDAQIGVIASRYNVGSTVSLEYVQSHLRYGATIINNKYLIEEFLYAK